MPQRQCVLDDVVNITPVDGGSAISSTHSG
jgi:hypothetical protein